MPQKTKNKCNKNKKITETPLTWQKKALVNTQHQQQHLQPQQQKDDTAFAYINRCPHHRPSDMPTRGRCVMWQAASAKWRQRVIASSAPATFSNTTCCGCCWHCVCNKCCKCNRAANVCRRQNVSHSLLWHRVVQYLFIYFIYIHSVCLRCLSVARTYISIYQLFFHQAKVNKWQLLDLFDFISLSAAVSASQQAGVAIKFKIIATNSADLNGRQCNVLLPPEHNNPSWLSNRSNETSEKSLAKHIFDLPTCCTNILFLLLLLLLSVSQLKSYCVYVFIARRNANVPV